MSTTAAPFSLDGTTAPVSKDFTDLIAGDSERLTFLLSGFESGDTIVATLIAKLDPADDDADPDAFSVTGTLSTPTRAPNTRQCVFDLTTAQTEDLTTGRVYRVKVTVTRATVDYVQTVAVGAIAAALPGEDVTAPSSEATLRAEGDDDTLAAATAAAEAFLHTTLGTVTSGRVMPTAGGTGLQSYAIGDTLYASATTTLAKLAIGAANRVMTSTGTAPQWTDTLTGLVAIAATTFTGALVGNASTATLAAAATVLATPRTINAVSFDGSANITVTAAADTLTGNTLNATVTGSSLTSLGTLTALAVGGLATVTSTTANQFTVGYDTGSNKTTFSTDSAGNHTITQRSGQVLFLNGPIQIGDGAASGSILFGIRQTNSTVTGTGQRGMSSEPIFNSQASVYAAAGHFQATFASGTYTVPDHFVARFLQPSSLPAGVTLTSMYGVYIGDVTLAGTNNYALYTNSGLVSFGNAVTVRSGGLTVTAGGVTVTGNSTITGTLGGVTTLTATTVSATNLNGALATLTAARTDTPGAGTFVISSTVRLGLRWDTGNLLNFDAWNGASWSSVMSMSLTGGLTTETLKTAAPSGGTAGVWKLGVRVAATVALDTSQYLQVDIAGTLYKVGIVT